jgi:hypothetical protein
MRRFVMASERYQFPSEVLSQGLARHVVDFAGRSVAPSCGLPGSCLESCFPWRRLPLADPSSVDTRLTFPRATI